MTLKYFFCQLLQNNRKVWGDVDLLGAENALVFAVFHFRTLGP